MIYFWIKLFFNSTVFSSRNRCWIKLFLHPEIVKHPCRSLFDTSQKKKMLIICIHTYVYEGVVVPESGDIETGEAETGETGIMDPVS